MFSVHLNSKIKTFSILLAFISMINMTFMHVEGQSVAKYSFDITNVDSYTGKNGEVIWGTATIINLDTVWLNIDLIARFNDNDGLINLSEKKIFLNPSETKQISFTINIPESYCSGTYIASLKAKLSSIQLQGNNTLGVTIGTALGNRFNITVSSSNACPTAAIVANIGGSGGGGSSGGNTSGTGGSPGDNNSGSIVPATIGRAEGPSKVETTTSPAKNSEEAGKTTSITSASCLLLNPESDSVASNENLNQLADFSGLLSMERKIADNYSKIISKFEKKKKIKLIFDDLKDRTSLRYIAALYDMKIISKLSDKQFKPNKNVNRAEYLKLVILATNENFSIKSLKAIKSFKDVKKESWYSKYIAFALKNKLIQGYSDQTFRPKNSVNIVEALNMTFNAFGIKPEAGLAYEYEDIPVNSWYKDIVNTSIRHCIIKQPQNQKFLPNRIVTREQAAIIVYRVLKLQYSQNGVLTAITSQK